MEEQCLIEETPHIPSITSPKEQLFSPDILGYNSHHAAFMVIINSKTGDVWINEEQENKPETGKKGGDINVISETAKHGETALQTVSYGIIEEFLGRDNITQTSQHLHLAWFNPKFCDYTAPSMDKPLSVAVGVFFYDGSDEAIQPDAVHEVTTKGWMSIDSLLSHPQVRHSASKIMGLMKIRGVFEEAESFHERHMSVPFYDILQSSFHPQQSASESYEVRMRQMDITSPGISFYRRPFVRSNS